MLRRIVSALMARLGRLAAFHPGVLAVSSRRSPPAARRRDRPSARPPP
jgi:hypothetical protein